MSEPTFQQRTGDDVPVPESTPEPVSPEFNYYVHLADGRVVKSVNAPLTSRWDNGDGTDSMVIGVYPR